jgi:hypothetical protein
VRPEILIAVDWSGALRGARHALWIAEARAERLCRLQCGRDREEAIAHILELTSREPRVVVGLDFAFSFPAWFLRERGLASTRELWDLARREGESWLARCEPPFWGRPGKRRPDLPPDRSPYRTTEGERLPVRGVWPKSVFQIGGAGSVGTGSIRGMPKLLELRAAGFAIWPFDPPRLPLALEIYPRWLTGRVAKSREVARRLFLAAHAPDEDPRLLELAASNEHAFDAAASALALAREPRLLAGLECETRDEIALEGRIWCPRGGPVAFARSKADHGSDRLEPSP